VSARVPLEMIPVGRWARVYHPMDPNGEEPWREGLVAEQAGSVTTLIITVGRTKPTEIRTHLPSSCMAEVLAEVIDAPAPQQPRGEGPMHFVCPDCGEHVAADEDGCCAMCGADCTGAACRCVVTPTPDPSDAEIARLRAECNEWRMACEGLPAASPVTLRATLREAGEIIDGLRGAARTDGATIGRLNAATVDLRTDRDTWRAVAEREETLAHQRNEIIAKLTADLAYHDRQAALHDATGKVAGHAEQCGCHGCTTGPLEREVARLRAALAKYGRHLVSCDLERCDGTGRPTRSVCTCGLADALTVQP
jgi:hypothetical protein